MMGFKEYEFDEGYFPGTLFKLMYHSTCDDEWHHLDTSFGWGRLENELERLKSRKDVDRAEIAAFYEGYFQNVVKGWERV